MKTTKLYLYQFILLITCISYSFADVFIVPEEFATIQEAVDQSALADTILLAPGLYTEHVEVTDHGVCIASHFLLTGDTTFISQTRWTAHQGESALYYWITDQQVIRVTGIQFENCNREDNRESPFGAAISSIGGTSVAVLDYCTFQDNHAFKGGGACLYAGSATVTNCKFIDNSAYFVGGGLYVSASTAHISKNLFLRNGVVTGTGGGSNLIANQNLTVENNTFANNISAQFLGGGLFINRSSEVIFRYNDIHENISSEGAGLAVTNSSNVRLLSNRFYQNHAPHDIPQIGYGAGAQVVMNEGITIFENNLFDGNVADWGAAALDIMTDCSLTNNIFRSNQAWRSILFVCRTNDLSPVATGTGNLILNNMSDDFVFYPGNHASLLLTRNDFIGNGRAVGRLENAINTVVVENNYWGHLTGPYHEVLNPLGRGDTIAVDVDVAHWSDTPFTNFQPPSEFALLSPPDGFTTHFPVSFEWGESTDPNLGDSLRYWVEISTDPEFDPDITRRWKLGTTNHLDSLRLGIGVYYWRVRCLDPLWLETLSRDSWQFEVTEVPPPPEPPAPFDLFSPEDGAYLNDSLNTFSWYHSHIPNGIGEVHYTLQLIDGADSVVVWEYPAGLDSTIAVPLPQWERLSLWQVVAVNDSSDTTWSNQIWSFFATDVEELETPILPEHFVIQSIHPNPFNGSVTVKMALPRAGEVVWSVVDLLGRVAVERSAILLSSGIHELNINIPGATGTYFLIMESTEGEISRHRLLLVK
ncbi:T9SS type A sorting domain-containing protein [bacterium]|nr:T9SS type A sorting domain-containing protein [bacterium]